MSLSMFDLFKIGIGPSSSHTVGPMKAAGRFLTLLKDSGVLQQSARVCCSLYGSLALTGKGHHTDVAIMLGLSGETPDGVDPNTIPSLICQIQTAGSLRLAGQVDIAYSEDRDIKFLGNQMLPLHSNGLIFQAQDSSGKILVKQAYYSVGGGFVLTDDEAQSNTSTQFSPLPYPFENASELLTQAEVNQLSFVELLMANERAMTGADDEAIRKQLLGLWQAMDECIDRGCHQTGVLDGGLNIKRRASELYQELCSSPAQGVTDPLTVLDWVNLYAMAVNEENAAGGRVVTAPTNGAAGVIPAVLAYYVHFCPGADDTGIANFLAVAAGIGMIYKKNASISAAEVGCQGEIGVACSMAAGALTAVMGGSNQQIENAAEIGMEHNLGLTCDPINGLVQVPCIERNTMGAVKAINASRLALRGNGEHCVPLDSVIETMRQTGLDMQHKYKETSLGGLAVNVVAC